ncbi:MAG: dihydroneopterin aldolase [Cyclobacteriaceae bacterium]
MGFIRLEELEFFAYHGFYDEEQKVGNKYSADITVEVDLKAARNSDKLNDTVNYEDLYQVAKEEMATPSRLLEHIAERIIDKVHIQYPEIKMCEVSISKYNPPVGGICKRAKVTLKEDF